MIIICNGEGLENLEEALNRLNVEEEGAVGGQDLTRKQTQSEFSLETTRNCKTAVVDIYNTLAGYVLGVFDTYC